MMQPGEILILTGAPGSGKTTAARALARSPGSPRVHLHADDFWHFIGNGAIPPYREQAQRQNEVVMDVVAGAAARYAGGGYSVIVDGIVGPWFLAPFRALAAPVHYVLLRVEVETAIARCQRRGGDTLSDPETIAALHDQFSRLGPLNRHVLAVDGLDRTETLNAIVEAVSAGGFRLEETS